MVKKIHSNQWIISKGRTDVTNDVRSFSYNERKNIMKTNELTNMSDDDIIKLAIEILKRKQTQKEKYLSDVLEMLFKIFLISVCFDPQSWQHYIFIQTEEMNFRKPITEEQYKKIKDWLNNRDRVE